MQYAQFRDELEGFLRDNCGVDPRIIGKNEYPPGNPLTKIKEVMETCNGVIVVAYERKYVTSGIEKRTGASPSNVSDAAYPTPWNHVESAMAFSLGIPIYIICQKGLVEEGLIETKLDWYVQYADIAPNAILQSSIGQSIQAWIKARVVPLSKKSKMFGSIEDNTKISELTLKDIGKALGFFVAGASFGISAIKLFPKLFS